MTSPRTLGSLAVLLSTFACSTEDRAAGADAGLDARDEGALPKLDPPSCAGSPLRVYEESPDVLSELDIDLPGEDGHAAPFLLDTGSALSFRTIPPVTAGDGGADAGPGIPDAGVTSIACVTMSLPGKFEEPSFTPDGVAAGGVVGTDLLNRGAVLDLQVAGSVMQWLPSPPAAPSGSVTLLTTFIVSDDPFAKFRLVATGAKLDGKDVRMLVDTGSPHVVIISATPRSNETEVKGIDGDGNPVTLFTSTIAIAFNGGAPHTVAIDRAEHFPTLEKVFAAIGGEPIGGILGLGALGHERIVISRDALTFVPGKD